MKTTVFLLSVIGVLVWCSGTSLYAGQDEDEAAKTEPEADAANWDDLFPVEDTDARDGERPRERRRGQGRRGDGPPPSPPRGRGQGDHKAGSPGGPGYGGYRPDGRPNGGPERRRRGFQRQVTEDALIEFLQKHEPELANKLASLAEKKRQYRRQINALQRLYGPVYYQMQRNPEMGELGLQKIRIQLKTKKFKRTYEKAASAEKQQKIKNQLRGSVGDLFDVIIQQEQLRFEEVSQRFAQWDQPEEEPAPEDRPEPPGPRKKRHDRRFGDAKKRQQHLQQVRSNLTSWQENRNSLIDQQVERLLTETTRPFPWPR